MKTFSIPVELAKPSRTAELNLSAVNNRDVIWILIDIGSFALIIALASLLFFDKYKPLLYTVRIAFVLLPSPFNIKLFAPC